MAVYTLDLRNTYAGLTEGEAVNTALIGAWLQSLGITVTSVTVDDIYTPYLVTVDASAEPDPYDLSQFVHVAGWTSGQPIPTPPAPGQPIDTGPPQTIYTKPITATSWATLARWTAGMTIPTNVIMAYIQHLGYTTTTQVDAAIDTGTVTITTTGSILTDALWAGFAGGSGAAKVEVTTAWTAFAESATTAVPTRSILLGLWFHLERNGVGPLTIFRRHDGVNYWIVLTTYGAIPAGVAESFVYRAPDPDDIQRVRVFSKNNPPLAGEQFYIALQSDAVLEVETGIDLAGLETVRDIVPIATETAQIPAQTQEIRALDLIVTPGFFEQVAEPASPREGDIWLNGTIYKQRIQGVWVDIPETRRTNQGSTGIGRLVVPVKDSTVIVGWSAAAGGSQATAVGAFSSALANASSAFGSIAKAEGFGSLALGRYAFVPASSSRGIAIGYDAKVPENMPNHAVMMARDLQLILPTGTGDTGLMLRSPDGAYRRIAITSSGIITVNGVSVLGYTTPVPGAEASTDGGYLMSQTIPSGIVTEVLGEILSFAINAPQIGTRDNTKPGGIFRLDSRAGIAGGGEFVVFGYAAGSNTAVPRVRIGLSDGQTRLAPSTGNVAIGQSGSGTAKLQIGAGAATAGNAPLKLTSGPLLTTPEAGAIEYDGEFSISASGGVRSRIEKVGHLHDDRYYTEAEVNSSLATKADTTHLHDDRYYTEGETNAMVGSAIPAQPWRTGRYYGTMSPPGPGVRAYDTLTLAQYTHFAAPFYVPAPYTIDQAGIHIETALAGGCRLFIYSINSEGLPEAYLVGTATISTSATGSATGALSYTFPSAGWYHAVIAVASGFGFRVATPAMGTMGDNIPANTTPIAAIYIARASTSPVSPFGGGFSLSGYFPLIGFRRA